jgi:ABC-type transport system involved in multi-copper enzyme maturation permease subunit
MRNIIILAVILILCLYTVHKGIIEYKGNIVNSENFREIEASSFKKIRNYAFYSDLGVRVLLVQDPAGIFFSYPAWMSELSGKVNSIIALEIFSNNKRQKIVNKYSPFRMRFSGIIFYIGTFAILLFGFDTIRHKEYLKYLSSVGTPGRTFAPLISARIMLFIFSFLLVIGCSLVLAMIEGIDLTSIDFSTLSGYLLSSILMLLMFFVCGTATGSIRSNLVGFIVLFTTWISLVFVIPGIIDSALDENNRDALSSYKLDLEKLRIVNEFEINTIKKMGDYKDNTPEGRRIVVEGYWNNEFKQLQALEEKHKAEIEKINNMYNTVSLFTPTTFYSLTAAEVSSRGFGNYRAFYLYLQELRQKFLRFWIDREYYHDPKVMVNFVKEDENLFQGKSMLPDNFAAGVAVNLGYFIILLIISYFRFKKNIYFLPDKKPFKQLDREREFEYNKINSFYTAIRPGIRELYYNYFVGRSTIGDALGNQLDIKIDGKETTGTEPHEGFVYFCHPEEIPGDITTKKLLNFIISAGRLSKEEKDAVYHSKTYRKLKGKNFSGMERSERVEAAILAIKYINAKILLVDRTCKDMKDRYMVLLGDALKRQKEKGTLVIYLSPDKTVEYQRSSGRVDCIEVFDWEGGVDVIRKHTKDDADEEG